jgi:AsmA protein
MKKPVRIGMIILAVLILLSIGFSLFVKSLLSGDRLKAFLVPKAEALTGRKINLDQIHVSLFKGIVVKGLTVKEKDGQADFLKTAEFVLSYRLWPLLKKQLVISEIEIVSPSISVRKEKGGKYNFSDLTEKPSRQPQKPAQPESREMPVAVIADKLLVRNASFRFVDDEKELPSISAVLDAEFRGGLSKEGTPRLESGRITLKEISIKVNDVEIKTSGKIEMEPQVIRADLKTLLGQDSIDIQVTAKDYLASPEITGNIHSRQLDLEKLMALGGGKKVSETPPQRKEQKPAASPGGSKLKASGQIKVDLAKYQGYTIRDFHMSYQYAKGTMKVDPLGLQFSGGDAFTSEGSVKGDLLFTGQDAAAIRKTLKGKIEAKLGKGRIKQSKILDDIALLTGLPSLKNAEIDDGLFNVDIRDERINVDGFVRSPLFKVSPKGWVDFEKKLDIPTELKIAPTISGGLSKGLASAKFLQDDQGWKVLPLRIKGTTEQPKVTLDQEALGSALIRGLERLFPGQKSEEPGKPGQKASPKDLFKGIFGK